MSRDYSMDTGTAIQITRNNSRLFKNLNEKMEEIAYQEVHKISLQMKNVLTHRKSLSGFGKFPSYAERSSSAGGYGGKTKQGYWQWQVKQKGERSFTLFNNARNPADGYNYIKNLVYGTSWPAKVKQAAETGTRKDGTPSRLVANGNRIFSKQMPQGLAPWIRLKKEDLKQNISDRIHEI